MRIFWEDFNLSQNHYNLGFPKNISIEDDHIPEGFGLIPIGFDLILNGFGLIPIQDVGIVRWGLS